MKKLDFVLENTAPGPGLSRNKLFRAEGGHRRFQVS
jgi:hypothetical protein